MSMMLLKLSKVIFLDVSNGNLHPTDSYFEYAPEEYVNS